MIPEYIMDDLFSTLLFCSDKDVVSYRARTLKALNQYFYNSHEFSIEKFRQVVYSCPAPGGPVHSRFKSEFDSLNRIASLEERIMVLEGANSKQTKVRKDGRKWTPPKRFTQREIDRMMQAINKGESFRIVAKDLDRNPGSIYNKMKQLKKKSG